MLSKTKRLSSPYSKVPQEVTIDFPDNNNNDDDDYDSKKQSSFEHKDELIEKSQQRRESGSSDSSNQEKEYEFVDTNGKDNNNNNNGNDNDNENSFVLPLYCITTGNEYVDKLLYSNETEYCFKYWTLRRATHMLAIWTFVLLFIDFILFGTLLNELDISIVTIIECIFLAIGGIFGVIATIKFDKIAAKLFYFYTIFMLLFHFIVLIVFIVDFKTKFENIIFLIIYVFYIIGDFYFIHLTRKFNFAISHL